MAMSKSEIVKMIESLDKRTAFMQKSHFHYRKNEKVTTVTFTRIAFHETLKAYPVNGGWYLSVESPWRKAIPAFTIRQGRIIAENTLYRNIFKDGEEFSLYEMEDETYFLAPSTDVEKRCTIGVKAQKTCWIPRARNLYISAMDFCLLSGMTHEEYAQIKDEIYVPKFVMEICLTDSERYIRLYVTDKETDDIEENYKAALAKHRKKKNGFKNVSLKYYVRPLRESTFCIPAFFLKAIGNPSEVCLPNTFDWENRVLTVEAPQEKCSCCGKPLPQKGVVIKRGTACYACTVTTQQIQHLAQQKTGTSAERVAQALNDIMAESERYSSVLSAISNQINNLKINGGK